MQTSCELLTLDHSEFPDSEPVWEMFQCSASREGECSYRILLFLMQCRKMVDSVAISGCFKRLSGQHGIICQKEQTVDKFYIIKRGVCKVFRKINGVAQRIATMNCCGKTSIAVFKYAARTSEAWDCIIEENAR